MLFPSLYLVQKFLTKKEKSSLLFLVLRWRRWSRFRRRTSCARTPPSPTLSSPPTTSPASPTWGGRTRARRRRPRRFSWKIAPLLPGFPEFNQWRPKWLSLKMAPLLPGFPEFRLLIAECILIHAERVNCLKYMLQIEIIQKLCFASFSSYTVDLGHK